MSKRTELFWLGGAMLLTGVGLLVYSQTQAFTWDEGFHLLSAQSISRGQRPYIDFCFPQTPLNAYWNAALFHLFGEGWRVTHLFAALFSIASAGLVADFVYRRFPDVQWRLAVALSAGLLAALNELIYGFGTVGQAYGMCLFASVAAFRLILLSTGDRGVLWTFAAGMFAGATAASSLLSAPVAAVLFLWILVYNPGRARMVKGITFLAGCALPFLPVFWLYLQAPKQTLFNVFQYQLLFRRVHWEGAASHDLETLSVWVDNGQAMVLVLLGVGGALYLIRNTDWDPKIRREFALAAWIGAALTAYLCTPHPTFTRYFVVAVPFAAITASIGLYAMGTRLAGPFRPLAPSSIMIVLVLLGLARATYNERDSFTWRDFETIARKVDEVTPGHGALYANELIYFLTKRPAPDGMEFAYAQKLELPSAEEKLYHIASQAELDKQVKASAYDTVAACDDDRIDELHLNELYSQKVEIADCTIFWQRRSAKH